MSDRALLNDNQHRYLETVVRLLAEALDNLRALPAPADAARWTRIQEHVRSVQASVGEVAVRFDLVVDHAVDPLRRVRAVASAWASELGGLTGAKLAGYGPVQPGLPAVLDPEVERLRRQLFALADATAEER